MVVICYLRAIFTTAGTIPDGDRPTAALGLSDIKGSLKGILKGFLTQKLSGYTLHFLG